MPNFIVSSSNGKIALVNAAVFELFTKEERRAELLVQGLESEISALCAHPSAPQVMCPVFWSCVCARVHVHVHVRVRVPLGGARAHAYWRVHVCACRRRTRAGDWVASIGIIHRVSSHF